MTFNEWLNCEQNSYQKKLGESEECTGIVWRWVKQACFTIQTGSSTVNRYEVGSKDFCFFGSIVGLLNTVG